MTTLFVRYSTFVSLLTGLLIAVSFSGPVLAQNGPRIAILDLGKVLVTSLAMKDVDRQLKELDKKFRADATAQELKFKDEQQKLSQQRAILQPAPYAEKQKALSVKIRDYRNNLQGKIRQIASGRSEAIKRIEKKLEPIVAKVIKEVGADILLEKKQIIFGTKNLEITERVAELFNQSVKTMPVKLTPFKKK
jgi:outer membrane protein